MTGKPRDTALANVYYDIRIIHERQRGFLYWTDTSVTKGIKLLSGQRTKSALEDWLRAYPDAIQLKEEMNRHHLIFYSKGAYKVAVENTRIDKRPGKDLLQDCLDAQAGISVAHEPMLRKQRRANVDLCISLDEYGTIQFYNQVNERLRKSFSSILSEDEIDRVLTSYPRMDDAGRMTTEPTEYDNLDNKTIELVLKMADQYVSNMFSKLFEMRLT